MTEKDQQPAQQKKDSANPPKPFVDDRQWARQPVEVMTMRCDKASDVFATIADFALTQPVGAQDSKVRNERGSIVVLDNAGDAEMAAWAVKSDKPASRLPPELQEVIDIIQGKGGKVKILDLSQKPGEEN